LTVSQAVIAPWPWPSLKSVQNQYARHSRCRSGRPSHYTSTPPSGQDSAPVIRVSDALSRLGTSGTDRRLEPSLCKSLPDQPRRPGRTGCIDTTLPVSIVLTLSAPARRVDNSRCCSALALAAAEQSVTASQALDALALAPAAIHSQIVTNASLLPCNGRRTPQPANSPITGLMMSITPREASRFAVFGLLVRTRPAHRGQRLWPVTTVSSTQVRRDSFMLLGKARQCAADRSSVCTSTSSQLSVICQRPLAWGRRDGQRLWGTWDASQHSLARNQLAQPNSIITRAESLHHRAGPFAPKTLPAAAIARQAMCA
jgi:hypothetical protein